MQDDLLPKGASVRLLGAQISSHFRTHRSTIAISGPLPGIEQIQSHDFFSG